MAHDADAPPRGARVAAQRRVASPAGRRRPRRDPARRGRRGGPVPPPLPHAHPRRSAGARGAGRARRRGPRPGGADRARQLQQDPRRGGQAAGRRRVRGPDPRPVGRSGPRRGGDVDVLSLRHARGSPRGRPDRVPVILRRRPALRDRVLGPQRRPALRPALRAPAHEQGGPAPYVVLPARARRGALRGPHDRRHRRRYAARRGERRGGRRPAARSRGPGRPAAQAGELLARSGRGDPRERLADRRLPPAAARRAARSPGRRRKLGGGVPDRARVRPRGPLDRPRVLPSRGAARAPRHAARASLLRATLPRRGARRGGARRDPRGGRSPGADVGMELPHARGPPRDGTDGL